MTKKTNARATTTTTGAPLVPITPAVRKRFTELAERICLAFISHQAGTSYRSAEYSFGIAARNRPIGDYWIAVARQIAADQAKDKDRADAKRGKEKLPSSLPR